jgi:hypothetical protein
MSKPYETAWLIGEMLLGAAGLLAVVAALFYGLSWAVLIAVRFIPVIGKRDRHERWDELNRRPPG